MLEKFWGGEFKLSGKAKVKCELLMMIALSAFQEDGCSGVVINCKILHIQPQLFF